MLARATASWVVSSKSTMLWRGEMSWTSLIEGDPTQRRTIFSGAPYIIQRCRLQGAGRGEKGGVHNAEVTSRFIYRCNRISFQAALSYPR